MITIVEFKEKNTIIEAEFSSTGSRADVDFGIPGPAGKPGKDGKPGRDGQPGKDGKDGKDGYTPVKNVDYFDGKDGQPGKDGYTPKKNVDYFDGKDGQPGKDGRTPVKGVDYFDGVDGYTPIKNVDYFDGKDGYTPQKGVDYWTAADKQEIAQYAKDSIVIPEVPTNVSAFNNDAGYLTEHQDLSEYAKLSDIPTFETEEWTFELEDGSTVTKAVVIG